MSRPKVLLAKCGERSSNILRVADASRFDIVCDSLSEHGAFESFDWVIPMRIQDTQYLVGSHAELNGIKFIAPALEALNTADNKILFNQFLRENGFVENLPSIESTAPFPYVVKRNRDAGGMNSHIVRNQTEADAVSGILQSDGYFSQEYVDGDTEFTDHIFFVDGKIQHSSCIEYRMNRDLYIRGTRMQPYTNVQMSVIEPRFSNLFTAILESLDFDGICCFNYKVIDGIPKIFELNPRVGGSIHKDINGFLVSMQNYLKSKTS